MLPTLAFSASRSYVSTFMSQSAWSLAQKRGTRLGPFSSEHASASHFQRLAIHDV
jgi:hypothetical protein